MLNILEKNLLAMKKLTIVKFAVLSLTLFFSAMLFTTFINSLGPLKVTLPFIEIECPVFYFIRMFTK